MKYRISLAVAVIFLVVGGALLAGGARPALVAENARRHEKNEPNLRALTNQRIDTSNKPKPNDDYVIATVDTECALINSGGFYLKKDTEEGKTIFRSWQFHVATSLKGYGTAGEYLVYELVDAPSPSTKKKIFFAFKKDYKPSTPDTVFLEAVLFSNTEDAPTSMASFDKVFSTRTTTAPSLTS